MALDGAMLEPNRIMRYKRSFWGQGVDKIYQLFSREEIAVAFRAHGQTVRLLLCAGRIPLGSTSPRWPWKTPRPRPCSAC